MANQILNAIDRNIRLSEAEEVNDKQVDGHQECFWRSKSPGKYAQAIFSQLCHPRAVDFVAKHFESLPEQVRIELRTLCSKGNGSGNVMKGVQALNNKMGGKLLREERVLTTGRRVEGVDGARYVRTRVNPAVAGATRKYQTTGR